MVTETKKGITVRLDPELWMRFRLILLGRGESAQSVTEDFIRRYVAHHESKEKADE